LNTIEQVQKRLVKVVAYLPSLKFMGMLC